MWWSLFVDLVDDEDDLDETGGDKIEDEFGGMACPFCCRTLLLFIW